MNISLSLSDILLVLPIICLFVVSLLPLAFKVFFRENSLFALMSGFMGILGAIGLTALIWGADKTAFSQALIFDGISLWSTLLILLITLQSFWFHTRVILYVKNNSQNMFFYF